MDYDSRSAIVVHPVIRRITVQDNVRRNPLERRGTKSVTGFAMHARRTWLHATTVWMHAAKFRMPATSPAMPVTSPSLHATSHLLHAANPLLQAESQI